MTMLKTFTQMMAEELREAEAILGALDQVAMPDGPPLSRAYSRFYNELLHLRDLELDEWNSEASCGRHDRRRMLYRCQDAAAPYHTPEEGPCEVYTPNWDASAGNVCDKCAAMRALQSKALQLDGGPVK